MSDARYFALPVRGGLTLRRLAARGYGVTLARSAGRVVGVLVQAGRWRVGVWR